MICDVSRVISEQMDVNIHKVTIGADQGIFDGSIEIRVHDRAEVKLVIENLKSVEGIQEVTQII